jgi:hypothetical protein
VGSFPREDNIFSYAGLVPRIYQFGSREYRGHITKGSTFRKDCDISSVQLVGNIKVMEKDHFILEFQ